MAHYINKIFIATIFFTLLSVFSIIKSSHHDPYAATCLPPDFNSEEVEEVEKVARSTRPIPSADIYSVAPMPPSYQKTITKPSARLLLHPLAIPQSTFPTMTQPSARPLPPPTTIDYASWSQTQLNQNLPPSHIFDFSAYSNNPGDQLALIPSYHQPAHTLGNAAMDDIIQQGKISHFKESMILNIQNQDLDALRANIVNNPKLFEICIQQDKYSQFLRAYSKMIRTLSSHTTDRRSQDLDFLRITILISFIDATTKEQFETIHSKVDIHNDRLRKLILPIYATLVKKGQALLHDFTPWHWNLEIMKRIQAKGVDMTIRTSFDDWHPGSTLGNNVAGLCAHRNDKEEEIKKYTIGSRGFLKWYWNEYPETLAFSSKSSLGRIFPWNNLSECDQKIIYPQLNERARQIINEQGNALSQGIR